MIASLCLWLLVRKVDVIENVVRAEAVVPCAPVSYTHLDVYKRQAQKSAPDAPADVLRGAEDKGAAAQGAQISRGDLAAVRVKVDAAPVSYTHLDVYKRQMSMFIKAKLRFYKVRTSLMRSV